MSTAKQAIAALSGIACGLVGAIGLSVFALSAVQHTASPGLDAVEIIVLLISLSVGFGVGVAVWAFASTRFGWLSWDQIHALLRNSEKS